MTVHADQLVNVQRLCLKLLYCANTVAALETDQAALLARCGVEPRWMPLLPDTRSHGHRAEMHGRRVLCAQDLAIVFDATLKRLVGPSYDTQAIISTPWFSAFLSSDAFFDPLWSLPHPAGFGRAYEGCSRFFFWARDAFGLRLFGADVLLRDDLYLDFAAWLDSQVVNAVDPAWSQLVRGFFWAQVPETGGPCRGLDCNRVVFVVTSPVARSSLESQGLVDLDRLKP